VTATVKFEPVSLVAKDVHLSFGANAVLRGVDLDVPAGTTTAVIGPSGSGKSTLLRALNRLHEPDRGDILLDGRSVLKDNPDDLRQRIGMVFQQFNLFPHRTVLDNVTLAPRRLKPLDADAARELGLAQLERVGLRHKAEVRPATLSGGQQQRVAIARALAVENPLLLLDEPFAALDALTRERLQEDLRRVSADTGRTSVFVTHSVDEAVFLGSRVVVLSPRPGRVILDLPIDLPRSGVAPDELRGLPAYAALRAELSHAVRLEGAST
jgi:polar amino acid transport system ATP-binding protein